MRKLFAVVTFLILCVLSISAQNSDSLLIENLKNQNSKLDNKLNTIIRTLSEEKEQQQKSYDSLYKLHQLTLKELNNINKSVLVENNKIRDSLMGEAERLNTTIVKANKKGKIAFIVHYILFGFLFILIFYLAIVLRISRRESIEFLLSQTDGLSQQNYAILEKAKELKKIKKELKEVIKQQKEEEKKKKKSKKKRKK